MAGRAPLQCAVAFPGRVDVGAGMRGPKGGLGEVGTGAPPPSCLPLKFGAG